MHNVSIYPSVIERVAQRRGGLRVFDSLSPKQTAHVVVDLQNGFMAPGAIAEIPAAREVVPTVNRISEALREAGGMVVYIQNTFDELAVRTWSTMSPGPQIKYSSAVEMSGMRRARNTSRRAPESSGSATKVRVSDMRGV